MCGIFGIIGRDFVDYNQFFELAESNTQRGNLGFGYITGIIAPDNAGIQTRVIRHAQSFQRNLVTQEVINIILAHNRAPTSAQSTRLSDVHPFESRDGYLAHNGLILNHIEYSNWYPGYSVDSQVIIGGIQHQLTRGLDLLKAIKITAESLEGQQGCWYWHKPSQQLYLWRVMSPIYVSEKKTVLYFSSTRCELAGSLLKEGVIYQYDIKLSCLNEAGTFEFQSPYLY